MSTAPIQPARSLDLPALAARLNIPILESLDHATVSRDFVDRVPISFARRHRLIALDDPRDSSGGAVRIALADPAAFEQLDAVARFLNVVAQPVFAPASAIEKAINAAYQKRTNQTRQFIDTLETDQAVDKPVTHEDLLDVANRAPVVKLVNLLLFEAVRQSASDIHLQPYEDKLVVRLRFDGVLFDCYDLPKHLQEEIISRMKVMARLNIAEKRLPQDGRASVQVGDRTVDLRVSVIPTSFGERLVVRLLDKASHLLTLPDLGMDDLTRARFAEIIKLEHGLILVTGPTGAGKSTTLYAAIQELDSKTLNILTLEDPIEYQLPGVSQTQVSEKRGMTFASGLRSVLRQDPDVIMVGEIRDHETAVMAIQSSLTGHMVFSTLHTNDAASAVIRLLDLGIEPFLVSSSLTGVLAQRLVRRVCPKCSRPHQPSDAELEQIGIAPGTDTSGMRIGAGCDHCHHSGYRGRFGLFELLLVNDAVRQRIAARDSAAAIKSASLAAGMKTLRDHGILNVLSGRTTIEEVLRVTTRTEV